MKEKDERIFFIFLFSLLVFLGQRVNFSAIVGKENQFFTLFQFFGPVPGSFLGPIFGSLAVLVAEVVDYLVIGKTWNLINLLRLTPMVFAAFYFGSKKKGILIIPLLAMLFFNLHPIGKQAWIYSLYWTIPLLCRLLPQKYSQNLFLRSLGATFTAHSIGSVAWIYTIPMTAKQWLMLIPVTAFERLMFSLGITLSYIFLNRLIGELLGRSRLGISPRVVFLDKNNLPI